MEYAFEDFAAGIAVFDIVYTLLSFVFAIVSYVLCSTAFYSIAKRRGINNPWMSWVPVLSAWVLGCISDQYQYVVKGRNKNKRKWLVGLNIALIVAYIAFVVFLGVFSFSIIDTASGGMEDAQFMETMMKFVLSIFAALIPMLALVIARMIIRYMAMYDLYSSCSPQNNVLFLVLSIFIPVTEPFFVFFNRKKDGGMPPRRPEPAAYIPTAPVFEPAPEEPRYEEPWNNEE